MRLFVKIIISILLLAGLLSFTLFKGKDGRPLMSLDSLKIPKLELPALPKLPGKRKQDRVYRWIDAEGVIHFTDTPPPAGVGYTVKGYDPDANLIQSVPAAKPVEPLRRKAVETITKKASPTTDAIGNPYSAGKVQKLMQDAKNVQKLLQDRARRQQALIDGQ